MTEANYQIVQSPYHGDGIIATKPLQCNDVVFSETPFFFLQSLPNRQLALVCSHCSRFLGSTGLQMKYLQKEITRQDLSEAGMKKEGFKEYFPLSEVVPCVLNCGELYCSSLCQQQHWCEKGHCLLCTGQIQEDQMEENALYQLKVFAVQSNEIFLMISDIIAEYITKHDPFFTPVTSSSSEPRPDSLAVFQHYVRNIWWEAISLPKVPTKRKQLQKTLQNLVNGLWERLNSTFQLKDRGLAGVFSKEWIARTIGMFEQNNVGVRVENPILTFIKQVDIHQQPEIVEEIFQEVIKIRDSIEDEGECYHDDDDDEDDEDEMEEGEGEGENEEEDMAVEDVEGNDTLNSEENSSLEPYQRRWAELQRIITEVGEDSLFPPLDGTAFFILTCKINHSCDPNVRVNYHIHPTKGLELKMLTIKDIGVGEELLQSYIDQFQDKKERQKALKDYGFTCQCSKCLSEA